MDGWRPTPIDEIGMPLSMRPPEYPIVYSRTDLFDRNHPFHPSRSSELNDDDAGMGLKNSRAQFVDWWEHHMVYHPNFYGPPLPASREAKFGLTVMSAAMYVPDLAIDCRDIDPTIVRLKPEERERMWTQKEIVVPAPGIVRSFLINYTLEQDLSHINESTIDEFLSTGDLERKRYLGHWLLSQAADRAAEPIDAMYRQAWKLGRIPPIKPAKPATVVQLGLGTVRHRDKLVTALQGRLVA